MLRYGDKVKFNSEFFPEGVVGKVINYKKDPDLQTVEYLVELEGYQAWATEDEVTAL